MTAVISACIYKNLSEFGEFLYNHFNIEDGKIKATFWHTVHIISRKVKKNYAVYGEGVVADRMC